MPTVCVGVQPSGCLRASKPTCGEWFRQTKVSCSQVQILLPRHREQSAAKSLFRSVMTACPSVLRGLIVSSTSAGTHNICITGILAHGSDEDTVYVALVALADSCHAEGSIPPPIKSKLAARISDRAQLRSDLWTIYTGMR